MASNISNGAQAPEVSKNPKAKSENITPQMFQPMKEHHQLQVVAASGYKTIQTSTGFGARWWVWYDGMPLSERGITNSDTDQMSFYLKTIDTVPLNDDGENGSVSGANFHIGTYICWDEYCAKKEDPNQHYYHYLN